MSSKIKYTIKVREPSWSTAAAMWEEFESSKEAEEFLSEVK